MITLVFAIVLFTSIAMVTNTNLLSQSEHVHKSYYQLQALQIAQKYFDEIDSKLFSENIKFNALSSLYDSENTFNLGNDNIAYQIKIETAYTDSLGNPQGNITNFQKVNLTITSTPKVIKKIQTSKLYANY